MNMQQRTGKRIGVICLGFLTLVQVVCAQAPAKQDSSRMTLYPPAKKDQQTSPYREIHWRGSWEMGKFSFDRQTAESLGIAPSGWTIIRLGGGLSFLKYLFIDAGAGLLHIKDHERFSQTVTGGVGGNFSRDEKSSITAGDAFIGLGASVSVLPFVRLEGMLGRTGFTASRTISFCTDCRRENVPLQGGNFIQYRVLFGKDAGVHFSYRKYYGNAHALNTVFIGLMYAGR